MILGEWVHSAHHLGQLPSFHQLDLQRTVVHSNIGTREKANHMSFLRSKVHVDRTEHNLDSKYPVRLHQLNQSAFPFTSWGNVSAPGAYRACFVTRAPPVDCCR